MAAGDPAGRALKNDSIPAQNTARGERLLVGDDAAVDVEHHLRGTLSDPLSLPHGFRVRFHSQRQHLHVRLRRPEIILAVPVRAGAIRTLHDRRHMHYSS